MNQHPSSIRPASNRPSNEAPPLSVATTEVAEALVDLVRAEARAASVEARRIALGAISALLLTTLGAVLLQIGLIAVIFIPGAAWAGAGVHAGWLALASVVAAAVPLGLAWRIWSRTKAVSKGRHSKQGNST